MEHLTPAERRERLARILLRGVYLYARSQGWVYESKKSIDIQDPQDDDEENDQNKPLDTSESI